MRLPRLLKVQRYDGHWWVMIATPWTATPQRDGVSWVHFNDEGKRAA